VRAIPTSARKSLAVRRRWQLTGKDGGHPHAADNWWELLLVPLLAFVPNVQEISVAGSRNPPAGFSGCTIQCGANSLFGSANSASGTLMAAPAFKLSTSLRMAVTINLCFPFRPCGTSVCTMVLKCIGAALARRTSDSKDLTPIASAPLSTRGGPISASTRISKRYDPYGFRPANV
jgi:hypothetical protein